MSSGVASDTTPQAAVTVANPMLENACKAPRPLAPRRASKLADQLIQAPIAKMAKNSKMKRPIIGAPLLVECYHTYL